MIKYALLVRYAVLVIVAACTGDPDGVLPPDAPVPLDHVSLRDRCNQPIDNGGAIAFPDTFIDARQTAVRGLVVFNDGFYNFPTHQSVPLEIEGPDAADFSVDLGGATEAACGFHEGLSISWPPFMVGTGCRIRVVFKPTTVGPKQATLTIRGMGIDASPQRYPYTLDQSYSLSGNAVLATGTVFAPFPEPFIDPYWSYLPPDFNLLKLQTTAVDTSTLTATGSFAIASTTCGASLPDSGCSVRIGFSAGAVGCPSGVLTNASADFAIPLQSWQ